MNHSRGKPISDKRKLMLQTAGFGLGTPRSTENLKVLRVAVKARMAARCAAFERLGAAPEVIAFLPQALASIEQLTSAVARD